MRAAQHPEKALTTGPFIVAATLWKPKGTGLAEGTASCSEEILTTQVDLGLREETEGCPDLPETMGPRDQVLQVS